MNALLFALALAAAGNGDAELPRSLSIDESRFIAPPPKEEFSIWVGGHLGVVGAYDGDGPAFVIGAGARTQILPWLAADVTIDFQTKQEVEDTDATVFQIPFMFAGVFYPPLELPLRPYGLFGFGFTITDVTIPGDKDETDANLLFFLGFGAEYDLSPNLMLDANVRFVFAQDPPHSGDFSADWAQFTVGILYKLGN
jgi:hypothetical protein